MQHFNVACTKTGAWYLGTGTLSEGSIQAPYPCTCLHKISSVPCFFYPCFTVIWSCGGDKLWRWHRSKLKQNLGHHVVWSTFLLVLGHSVLARAPSLDAALAWKPAQEILEMWLNVDLDNNIALGRLWANNVCMNPATAKGEFDYTKKMYKGWPFEWKLWWCPHCCWTEFMIKCQFYV